MPREVEVHPEVLKPQSDTGIPRGQNAALMLTADEQKRKIRREHRKPKFPLRPVAEVLIKDGTVTSGAGSAEWQG